MGVRMLTKSREVASGIVISLAALVALEGVLTCNVKREACQLVIDKRTHSERHVRLIQPASGEPYFAPGFESAYVRIQGDLKDDTLSVITLRHAMPQQPFERGSK